MAKYDLTSFGNKCYSTLVINIKNLPRKFGTFRYYGIIFSWYVRGFVTGKVCDGKKLIWK